MAPKTETPKRRSYTRNPKRGLAEILYVECDRLQREIAEELEVGEHTISRWAKEDNWDAKRQVRRLSPDSLIQQLYEQSDLIIQEAKLNGRALTAKECDAINKLATSIQKIDKRTDPSMIMAVLVQFNNYLKTENLELAQAMLNYQKKFVMSLLPSHD